MDRLDSMIDSNEAIQIPSFTMVYKFTRTETISIDRFDSLIIKCTNDPKRWLNKQSIWELRKENNRPVPLYRSMFSNFGAKRKEKLVFC